MSMVLWFNLVLSFSLSLELSSIRFRFKYFIVTKIFFHWTQSKYVINYVSCRIAIEKSIERMQQSTGQRSKWLCKFRKTFEAMKEIQRSWITFECSNSQNHKFRFEFYLFFCHRLAFHTRCIVRSVFRLNHCELRHCPVFTEEIEHSKSKMYFILAKKVFTAMF